MKEILTEAADKQKGLEKMQNVQSNDRKFPK